MWRLTSNAIDRQTTTEYFCLLNANHAINMINSLFWLFTTIIIMSVYNTIHLLLIAE